jgi:SNF2 family DNA or RNA helicase
MLDIDPENLAGADAETLGSVSTVRRQMGEALAPAAADYVEMILEGGEEKVIVFYHHKNVGDYLQRHLSKYGVIRVDGSVAPSKKQGFVDLFKQDKKKRIFLGQTLSVGTGTDGLQECAWHGVMAEPDWTPGVNQQAVDRMDRGGQVNEVQFDFIVARGSYAEKVLATSLRKEATVEKALDKRIGVW